VELEVYERGYGERSGKRQGGRRDIVTRVQLETFQIPEVGLNVPLNTTDVLTSSLDGCGGPFRGASTDP